MLEFSARSTGEPSSIRSIRCDMKEYIPGVSFPVAGPRVIKVTRSFWEKVTAAHIYRVQGKDGLSDRFSRRFHVLVPLKEDGYLDNAIEAQNIAEVVDHPVSSPVTYTRRGYRPLPLAGVCEPPGCASAASIQGYCLSSRINKCCLISLYLSLRRHLCTRCPTFSPVSAIRT